MSQGFHAASAHGTHAVRVERLIAGARVALAAISLLAQWLDPSQPAAYAAITLYLLAGYLVVSAASLAVVWTTATVPRHSGLVSHVFDLVMFGLVVSLTRGPSSPFFMFFVFALVSGALRWQWWGVLWTGSAGFATLLGSGLWGMLISEAGLELNRFLIRGVYLVVVAVLLGYVSDHEKRLRDDASQVGAMVERTRFARDLHDGVVQSLTGVALRLRTLPALFDRDPETARRTVEEIGDLIADEQRELRSFVDRSRAGGGAWPQPLAERLEEIRSRLERHWDLRVECDVDLEKEQIPVTLADEISKIVLEAGVNSARHGKASAARVRVAVENGRLAILVEDDGHGFPFCGRYRLAELVDQRRGPRSLRDRISALGGDLTLDSSEGGARLEIALPLGERKD